MANDTFKIKKALNIEPNAAPNLSTDGDIGFNSGDSNLEVYAGGSVKKVVTTTQTQTLTNKTLTAPTVDVAILDGQASAPANPSAGYYKMYVDDTTSRLQLLDSAGTITTVGSGSGGGINYCENPDAEGATTGWATYADAAASTPVDGTGGSPSATFTRSTSSPLRGIASFVLSKGASNRQGDGASYDFTIDTADQGKPMTISFDYYVSSGTYATGDVGIYIYDVTNSTLIQPSGYQVVSASVQSTAFATFQAASNSTSYRLILHIASTSASAYDLKIDNVYVGPQQRSYGPAMTDWVSYTPTLNSDTNVSVNAAYWRRVGDSIQVMGHVIWNGAGAAGAFTVSLPSGKVIDTTRLPTNMGTATGIGWAELYDAGVSYKATSPVYSDTTSIKFAVTGTGGNYDSSSSGNGDEMAYGFILPIVGWSSNTLVSDSASTRTITTRMYRTSTTTVAPNNSSTKVAMNGIIHDSAGAADTTNGRVNVVTSGYYQINCGVVTATTNVLNNQYAAAVAYNGSIINYGTVMVPAATTQVLVTASGTYWANAGDYFECYLFGAGNNSSSTITVNTAASGTFLEVTRVQGPAQIAASEIICAKRYSSSTAWTYNSATTLAWTTSLYDSHGGWGSTSVYTVSAPGKYNVRARAALASSAASAAERVAYLLVRQNSTVKAYGVYDRAYATTAREYHLYVDAQLDCVAGDTIDIQGFANLITSTNINNNGGGQAENFVIIERVGGI